METEANSEETTQVSSSVVSDTDAPRLHYDDDDNFEYEAIKFTYLNHFREFFQTSKETELRDHAPTPDTRSGVSKYIEEINKAYDLIKSGGLLNEFQCRALQRFEVIERSGEDVLIAKRKSDDEPVRRVLGAEQCFEVLVETHRAACHAGLDVMLPFLARRYVVPPACVTFFLKLCNVCKRSRPPPPPPPRPHPHPRRPPDVDVYTPTRFNHTVRLDILLLTERTDEFHYILRYRDTYTNFVLLRPIVTIEETALSVEFFKIFADFGLPLFIRASDDHVDSMRRVLSLLKKTWPTYKISVHVAEKTVDGKVVEILSEWMNATGCTNWGIACHVMQKKLNNIKCKDRSPYDLVFGVRPPAEPAPTSPEASTSISAERDPENTFTSSEESDSDSDTDPIVLNPDMNDTEHRTEPIASEDVSEDAVRCFESISPGDTLRRQNDVRGSERHKKTYDTICGECNTRIIIPYICNRCCRPIHLFCSQKNITLHKYRYKASVVITCRSCSKLKEVNKYKKVRRENQTL